MIFGQLGKTSTVSEQCWTAATVRQSFAGACRHAATGVAPRCNLTRESAGLQTDSNCDTTESNAEQPIMRGRVLLDKHSHGLSEPRAKHQFANKVTKPIRLFRAAKYTPRKSTSCLSLVSIPNHQDGNTSKLAKVR